MATAPSSGAGSDKAAGVGHRNRLDGLPYDEATTASGRTTLTAPWSTDMLTDDGLTVFERINQ